MEYVTEQHIRVCWRLVGLPSPVVLVKVAVGTHDDCEVVHNGENLQPASCLDGFNARSQLNYILENFSLPQAVTDDGWQIDRYRLLGHFSRWRSLGWVSQNLLRVNLDFGARYCLADSDPHSGRALQQRSCFSYWLKVSDSNIIQVFREFWKRLVR